MKYAFGDFWVSVCMCVCVGVYERACRCMQNVQKRKAK